MGLDHFSVGSVLRRSVTISCSGSALGTGYGPWRGGVLNRTVHKYPLGGRPRLLSLASAAISVHASLRPGAGPHSGNAQAIGGLRRAVVDSQPTPSSISMAGKLTEHDRERVGCRTGESQATGRSGVLTSTGGRKPAAIEVKGLKASVKRSCAATGVDSHSHIVGTNMGGTLLTSCLMVGRRRPSAKLLWHDANQRFCSGDLIAGTILSTRDGAAVSQGQ